ncbi:MAG: branched-chain amino acid transporter permease [Kiritimatiellia bacterium]
MTNGLLYLAGVIGVAWLVTFALRALPFVLFAGQDRELPPSVERVAGFISPVIIAGLIVYSYYGLYKAAYFDLSKDWAWPFVAGVLTVGLQLWKGNPLVSILAGTILYMSLIGLTGCVSVPVETIRSTKTHPLIRITSSGILYRGQPVLPEEVGRRLDKDKVSKTEALHVLVDPDFTDQQALWVFRHNYLDRAGYTRSVMMNGEPRGVSGTSDLRENFESKGRVIPYEKRFQKKGGPSWR